MYQCGDQVVYGVHGVCRILELEKRKIDRKLIEYYVLEPVDQPGTRFYVPIQNVAAVSKMLPLITQGELDNLLKSYDDSADAWIEAENQRKQYYRELLVSGDRKALIRMVHTLYKRKSQLLESGRKFHQCDENFLRDAEKLLNSEFSLVLNVAQNQVKEYVQKRMTEI